MLTLGTQPPDRPAAVFGDQLEIPNRVIRELQWEHLANVLRDDAQIALDTRELEAALEAMALRGDIAPFLELFHARVVKAVGLKDLRRFEEKSIKLMLLAFISLSRLFHPLSERDIASDTGNSDGRLSTPRLRSDGLSRSQTSSGGARGSLGSTW
jgi:hypothetical protein